MFVHPSIFVELTNQRALHSVNSTQIFDGILISWIEHETRLPLLKYKEPYRKVRLAVTLKRERLQISQVSKTNILLCNLVFTLFDLELKGSAGKMKICSVVLLLGEKLLQRSPLTNDYVIRQSAFSSSVCIRSFRFYTKRNFQNTLLNEMRTYPALGRKNFRSEPLSQVYKRFVWRKTSKQIQCEEPNLVVEAVNCNVLDLMFFVQDLGLGQGYKTSENGKKQDFSLKLAVSRKASRVIHLRLPNIF